MGKLKKKIENKVFGTKEERAYKKIERKYDNAPAGNYGGRNYGRERISATIEKGEHKSKKRKRVQQWVEAERAKKYPAAAAAGKKNLASQKMTAPPT